MARSRQPAALQYATPSAGLHLESTKNLYGKQYYSSARRALLWLVKACSQALHIAMTVLVIAGKVL
jgi:hypothetical protein